MKNHQLMKTILLLMYCLLTSLSVWSQTIEYFDAEWNRVDSEEKAAYYRQISYDRNGKPINTVRDFFISGELQFEGKFISVNPDTLDGLCTWYYRNGQKKREATYRNGEAITIIREWTAKGKEEGVLDESGFYFSEQYRQSFLRELGGIFNMDLAHDSITIDLLLQLGGAIVGETEFEVAIEYFRLAHDLSVLVQTEDRLAVCYNNMGAVNFHHGRYERSVLWYEKAIGIQRRLFNNHDLFDSYNNMGAVRRAQGKYDQALSYYEKAMEVLDGKMERQIDLATCYNNMGTVFHDQGKFAEAIGKFKMAIEIQQNSGQEVDLAISYNNIGSVYKTLGKYALALMYFDSAVAIQVEVGEENELATSYSNIGAVHDVRGDFDLALIYYQRALEIWQNVGSEVDVARSYNNIGFVYSATGKYWQALGWFEKSKAIEERLGLELLLAKSYNNIGVVHSHVGNFDQALDFYDQSIKVLEKLGIGIELHVIYNNKAFVLSSRGQHVKALTLYRKAKEIQEKLGLEVDLARSYNNIGFVFDHQGKYDLALSSYRKAEKILEKLKLIPELARSLNNIGGIYESIGQFEEALKLYRQAIHLQKEIKHEVDLASSYNNLAVVYQSLDNYQKALNYYGQAKDIGERLGLEKTLATTYNNLGTAYYYQERFAEALELYRKSEDLRARSGDEVGLANSQGNLSLAFYSISKLDSSAQYAQRSMRLNHNIRQRTRARTDRHLQINKSLTSVEVGLLSAAELGKPTLAFEIAESSKARSLADLLVEKSILKPDLPDQLDDDYANLSAQMELLNHRLPSENSDERRSMLLSQRDSLYQERKILEDMIRETTPHYASLVYPNAANLKEVQAVLNGDETIIDFFVGSVKTVAFVITPSEIQMVDLGHSHILNQMIEQFQNEFIEDQKLAIERDDPLSQMKANDQFFEISSKLYEKLWSPIDAMGLEENSKILLMPDGFLNYMPFELLIKDRQQMNYQDYQYLIRDHAISYYPSATLLHFERTKKKLFVEPNKDFFGLGISEFENSNCAGVSSTYGDLSAVAASIKQLGDLFDVGQSTIVLNEQANESVVKSFDFADYRYLHFATHGTINTEIPDFSSLLLLPYGQEDGCLNMYEIFDLNFNADLVTIAACQTGLGKLVRGEGIVGFTRALMYAGTPSVILSLWEVADESTNQLFLDYYSKLASDGSDKYEPLRVAQLKMIESEEYSNPYYWAPFVFIGAPKSKL